MIIGIGGVSNSGKSSLAKKIGDLFPDRSVVIVCQDKFVFSEEQISKINNHTDWEAPSSIDFKSFIDAIQIAAKEYQIVIAEGLLVFHDPQVLKLFQKKIFITLSEEAFYERKVNDLRWGREPEWYIKHIWNAYEKFGKISPDEADLLMVDGEKPFEMGNIMNFLKK
ncbi:MAG: hypothetical protein JW731_02720 [Bacteroidales bacterium]|nr:hypothetical protein [Bacteroidales bacterium]